VVVFDTLLDGGDPRRVALVVAHEFGHRRDRHVAKLTALGMIGAAGAVVALWALLQWDALLGAIDASGPGDPRILPFVFFSGLALELLALPALAALSRRYERAADRASLDLTGEPAVFEDAHRELARSNVSDLDPPRVVYLALFTHPTAPERIAAARTWTATRV
jgi:STE24 endopeptidase